MGAALALALTSTSLASAHSELVSSSIDDGQVIEIPPPFNKRIVLQFSEPLAEGSKASLIDVLGGVDPETGILHTNIPIAGAVVDGTAATMTFPFIQWDNDYTLRIEWTSIAGDGDVLRGTIDFEIVRVIPSPTPTAEPTPEPSASATPAVATASPSPSESATPVDTPATTGTTDVLIPIVLGLLIAFGGGAYLLSRRGRTAA